MKAVVFHSAKDLRIEDVQEPVPLPGQVKLRNAYVGICGSDLHVYYEPESSGSDFSKPHPLTGAQPPQIMGHEFSGTVVEVGEGVDDLSVGDRVAVWPVYYCGRCRACEKGLFNVCTSVGFHGVQSVGGGLATFTTVKAGQCQKLPESVDLRLGALVEPMAVGWRAVRRSRASQGDRALIIGAGPIGISLFIALRERGVEQILISDPNPERRAAIQGLGVAHVLDPSTRDLASWVKERTGGEGVDYVFDAAGNIPALVEALTLLTPGGTAVVVAVHSEPFMLHPVSLLLGEITLMGTCAYGHEDFVDVIDAMSKGVYSTTGWVDEVAFEDVESTIIALHDGHGVKALVNVAGSPV